MDVLSNGNNYFAMQLYAAATALQMRHSMDDTYTTNVYGKHRKGINPFNASCSKLLLFEGFNAILV